MVEAVVLQTKGLKVIFNMLMMNLSLKSGMAFFQRKNTKLKKWSKSFV